MMIMFEDDKKDEHMKMTIHYFILYYFEINNLFHGLNLSP